MFALPTPASSVEFVLLVAGGLLGLSHIVQPRMWADYFEALAMRGRAGVVTKIMQVELWPALLIVGLHQVWSGPGIVVTVLGWLLLAKVAMGSWRRSWQCARCVLQSVAPAVSCPRG